MIYIDMENMIRIYVYILLIIYFINKDAKFEFMKIKKKKIIVEFY